MAKKDISDESIPDYRDKLPQEQPVPKDKAEADWGNKQLKPKEFLFLEAYFDPDSETFNNFSKSAKLAGFTGLSASNPPNWLKIADRHLKSRLVAKAERNIDKFLDMDISKAAGDEVNTSLAKIKADMSKFTAERLDKDNYAEGNVMVNLDV